MHIQGTKVLSNALVQFRHHLQYSGKSCLRFKSHSISSKVDIEVEIEIKEPTWREIADSMPQSPLTNVKIQEKWKYRNRRKPVIPREQLSAFQEELRRNPYANALATTVRTDLITGNRLPTFFLERFEIIREPSKKASLWHLPSVTMNQVCGGASSRSNPSNPSHPSSTSRPSTSYMLSSHPVLDYAAKLTPVKYIRSLPLRIRSAAGISPKSVQHSMKAAELVLRALRDKIIQEMKRSDQTMLVPLDSNADIPLELDRAACILHSGAEALSLKAFGSFNDATLPGSGPQCSIFLVASGKKIPAYDMNEMLGAEMLKDCLDKVKLPRDNAPLAIRISKKTLRLQISLWRLYGYLAS